MSTLYPAQYILCFPNLRLLCYKGLREFEKPVLLISNGSPDVSGSVVHAVLQLGFENILQIGEPCS